eukprot:6154023-Pyramimonas_sp.AAC.1
MLLVCGKITRLSREMLSDDRMGLPGRLDCLRPATEQDSAGAEFARSQSVRDVARRLAMEIAARDKLHTASKARGPSQM